MQPMEILATVIIALQVVVMALLIALLRRRADHTAADLLGGLNAAEKAADERERRIVDALTREGRQNQSALRTEMQNEMRGNRTETTGAMQTSMDQLGKTLRRGQGEMAEMQDRRMAQMVEAQEKQFAMQDKRLDEMQKSLNALLSERMTALNTTVEQRLTEVEKHLKDFREQSRLAQEDTRRTMETRLGAMQAQNAEQLDKMRATVDEKLQKTLDERISQSFKMVNDRLTEVYKGLGEMQTLAANVGDLKKVMSGVKTRGILGELQLGALIQEMLTPDQYEENIPTKPGSANRVEYAIRLPGEGEGNHVYLPVDAKFPADAYRHLLDAYDSGDAEAVKLAGTTLEQRIKSFAKDIRDKYVAPPHTTPFAIMFLPFEGLYAEVVRRDLTDILRRQYQVTVAGPTTFAALLSSLQMGFRTLAVQKRSSEVWEVLGAVKTEFGNFETVLAKAKARIDQTGDELEKLIGVRTRKINSKLRRVEELPAADAQRVLADAEDEE